jgi:hypothetical protein
MGAAAARWETVLREEEEEEMAALRACACGRRSGVVMGRVGDGCVCAGAMRSVERQGERTHLSAPFTRLCVATD